MGYQNINKVNASDMNMCGISKPSQLVIDIWIHVLYQAYTYVNRNFSLSKLYQDS